MLVLGFQFFLLSALFFSRGLTIWRIEDVDEEKILQGVPKTLIQSPKYLLDLAKHENVVYNALLNFIHEFSEAQLPTDLRHYINLYLDDYVQDIQAAEKTSAYSSYGFTTDYTTIIAQNPILAFKMLWRFADELKIIHNIFMRYKGKRPEYPMKSYFVDPRIANTWPTEPDVHNGIVKLLRLQMVYDLSSADLASGIIGGIETHANLRIHQCLKIGEHAITMTTYSLAIPWLELAISKIEASDVNDRYIKVEDIEEKLNVAISMHDATLSSRPSWNYYYYNHTLNNEGVRTKPTDRVSLRKIDRSAYRRKKDPVFNEPNYWSLCGGYNHQSDLEISELYCWYETKRSPALTIFPVKMELLSKSPYIVQMYELINNSTMFKLVELASANLKRSRTGDYGNRRDSGMVSHFRTSVESGVNSSMPELQNLVELTTGLLVSSPLSAEPYLVTTYSFGGHYDCHLDAYESGVDAMTGNRIATIMFYLVDTPFGGYTAFPQAGVAARPIKGSAVFWYNLKQNSERDLNTYHCACPVILGHKIISTQWINHNDQYITRPCALSQDE